MVDQIKQTLFVDRFRSYATLLVLLLILVVIFCGWMFPHQPKVEHETLNMVAQGLAQLKDATISYQKHGEEQMKLNRQISSQLNELKRDRALKYDELKKKYDIPDIDGSDDVIIPMRVQQQN